MSVDCDGPMDLVLLTVGKVAGSIRPAPFQLNVVKDICVGSAGFRSPMSANTQYGIC